MAVGSMSKKKTVVFKAAKKDTKHNSLQTDS